MRSPPGASSTALCLAAALAAAGCAASPRARAPRREPPARVLVVALDRIALRQSAALELHAWLAAAARGGAAPPTDSEAVEAYGRALAGDDADALVARTSAALAPCADDGCAKRALAGTPLAAPLLAQHAIFFARDWRGLATSTRQAIEAVRGAWSEEADALLLRVARDLAIALPEQQVVVDVVTSDVPPGRAALVPAVLAAHGRCFQPQRGETGRMHRARIIDCVVTYAALGLGGRSELFAWLDRALGPEEASRAWSALVVHAAAATVAGWEPRHDPILRRSAAAVAPRVLAWLADHWRSRAAGEDASSFAARYAAALR